MRNLLTRDVAVIVVLVVIMIVAGLMLSSQSGNGDRGVGVEAALNPSIYNDRASGMRAFFEWTGKLGRTIDVDRSSWTALPDNAQMLVSIQPNTGGTTIVPMIGSGGGTADQSVLTQAEAESVKRWLAPGRTLLLMTSNLPGAGSGLLASADQSAQFGNALGIDVSSAIGSGYQKYLSPSTPIALLEGVSSVSPWTPIEAPSGSASYGAARVLRNADDAVTLFGSPPKLSGFGPKKGMPFAIEFAIGKGHVVVIADSEFACNDNLVRADNAIFLSNIYSLYTRPGDRVLFDEYHHGDIAATSEGLWQAMGHPVQLAIIQAGLGCVILLVVLGSRFGSPMQLTHAARRTSGEYVTSLAGLYRSAKASTPALEIVYRQFLRDLCSRLALPADVSLEELADAAARRANLNKVNLRRLFSNCERGIDQQNLTEGDFLELVRQMERFRKDLGID